MKLTKKQIEFAKFMVENIMEGVMPVIREYIDSKVERTKEEIISEVNENGSVNVGKLDKTKNSLKEHTRSIARDLFTDEDFGTAYDNLKDVSPKNPVMNETSTDPSKIRDANIDNLEINYNKEVSLDSVLKMADQVNESIITGDYKNPSVNMVKKLETQDFSRFLE